MGEYRICKCGHRDDWHQTCSTSVILDDRQKPCYGTRGRGCDCAGWSAAIQYSNRLINPIVDRAGSFQEVIYRLRIANYPYRLLVEDVDA